MIGEADELFVHQTIDTIDHVATTDFRFTDRLVFYVHNRPGDVLLMFGLGAFPNMNTMDGYCLAWREGVQYNVRFSRELRQDRHKMDCGPLHIRVIEPLRHWHVRMDENDYGVAFDVHFHARSQPFEHSPIFMRDHDFLHWHQIHYQQSGNCSGWISIGGERQEFADWWGSRDRSWGVRGGVPGSRMPATWPDHFEIAWMTAQFDDFTLQNWCFKDFAQDKILHIDGAITPNGGREGPHFVDWSYEVLDGQAADGGPRVRNLLMDRKGNRLTLDADRAITVYIGGILFNDGGFYGKWRGDTVEGEQWTRAQIEAMPPERRMASENLVTYRLDGKHVGYGIYESKPLFDQPPGN